MSKKKKKKRVLKKPNIDFSKIQMVFKYHAINFIVPLIIVLVLGVAFIVFIEMFKVKTINVEGAQHYSNQEIIDYVLDSKLCENTVFVKLKYKYKNIKDLPFVERIDVKIKDRNTVEINVYEKYLAGCAYNLGNYLYFDNDGIIVEVSKNKTSNVPVVNGLEFESFTIHEPLPVANTDIFQAILDVTKLLNKYNLKADSIYFDENMNVSITFDEVRVNLGDKKDLEEKFLVLPNILPSLEGKKGVLHMEKFSETERNAVFDEDV